MQKVYVFFKHFYYKVFAWLKMSPEIAVFCIIAPRVIEINHKNLSSTDLDVIGELSSLPLAAFQILLDTAVVTDDHR